MMQRVTRVSRSAGSILSTPFELFLIQIFTVRNSTIRIISARKANKREGQEYDKNARHN